MGVKKAAIGGLFSWANNFRHFPQNGLQNVTRFVIIYPKNKDAAAYGCGNTRKPMQVLAPPTQ